MSSLLTNIFWKYGERTLVQLVTFIVSIILARLLLPSDYGLIAMVSVFIHLANVFVEGGFNSALIQKQDADDEDFSTVQIFSLLFSVALYCLIYVSAPSIASFYGDSYDNLEVVLRVLSLQIIILAFNSVQQAYFSKKMLFRSLFYASAISAMVSGFIGIVLAYKNFGIWSLVLQQILQVIFNTLVLCFFSKKFFISAFSFYKLKSLIDYGLKIFGASLLITGYQEIRALVIGKLYSSSSLAYFDRARQFPGLIVNNINTTIGAVLFPKLSLEQNNIVSVKEYTRMSIRFSAYIMTPLMIGLFVVAEPLVLVLLTDKWLPCVPLLRLFCILNIFQPIHTANLQSIKAIGRSDIFLYLEIIKKTLDLIVLLLVVKISVYAIVLAMTILCGFFSIINAFPNIKLLDYSIKEQIIDVLPSALMSILMGVLISVLGYLNMNPLLLMITQFIAGVLIYLGLSVVTNNSEFKYIVRILKR